MKKHFQAFIGAFCLCIPVVGQSQDLVQDCQERLMEAETNPRDSKLYSQCGFDNEQIAFGTWLSWAQENNAYQALFEIANRHPQNLDSEKIMLQAVEANNGSALILQGDKFYYSEKDFPQAITSYAKALKAKNLTEEEIFKKHFGGIYYVFLRGTRAGEGNGIYAQTWDSFETLKEAFGNVEGLMNKRK